MALMVQLSSLAVRNFLSFGKSLARIELGDLTVLIGPNGSGKSNVVEALALLKSLPRDLRREVHSMGGRSELWWKGPKEDTRPVMEFEASLEEFKSLRYSLALGDAFGVELEVRSERIESRYPGSAEPDYYYRNDGGSRTVRYESPDALGWQTRELGKGKVDPWQSILSQLKDAEHYPELDWVGQVFSGIRIYRDWTFGRAMPARELASADLEAGPLTEDGSNLGLVLNRLLGKTDRKAEVLENLRLLYDSVDDIHSRIFQGFVETRLQERGLRDSVPLRRLSDGTLRWLALLAILLDREQSSLVCIEEPELGLHPDLIIELARLLRQASEYMQIIVTTHSADLVEQFSDSPESVVVCEKSGGVTSLRRLERNELGEWLERYSLGQLWRQGHLGGNRW